MGKIVSTLILVVAAVVISGAVWLAPNLWLNLVRDKWRTFSGITYGVAGFLIVVVLHGNGVLRISNDGFLNWVWPPLVIGLLAAAAGYVMSGSNDRTTRMLLSVGGLGVTAVVVGLLIDPSAKPDLAIGPLIGWTVGGAAIGAAFSFARHRSPMPGVLVVGAVGWLAGSWGSAELGAGTTLEAVIAAAVPALAIGVCVGRTSNPDRSARVALDLRIRPALFLAPALIFMSVTLLIPAIRTLYLSFYDNRSVDWVGLRNYTATFTDPVSFNASNWTDMFGSRLLWIGLVFLAIAALVGFRQRTLTGRAVEIGNPTSGPLLLGALLIAFAVFTAFRGTVVNNLWWVVVVTFLSTALGLAVAVLADGVPGERIAKSIVFMPMAISFVGASIIWRFMYVPRNPGEQQTGVMNALWVGLGNLSTGSGIPSYAIGVIIGLALLGLLVLVARSLPRREYGRAAVPGLLALLVGWLFIRYWGIVGGGVGGFRELADGSTQGQPVPFIQESPFNNFWLMVVLIWIQTGFAMVILSAAIRAVPEEYLEAARVDGATQSQIFWRIILPQIATTIGVVVTTTIVLVMKVFDIVKVMTNGNLGTQVLANDMFQQAFLNRNTGRGAALAILILVSVVPVMYVNVRRMQREN